MSRARRRRRRRGGGLSQSTAEAECQAFAEATGIDFSFLQEVGSCDQFDDGVDELDLLQGGNGSGFDAPEVPADDDDEVTGTDNAPATGGQTDNDGVTSGETISLASLGNPREWSVAIADVEGSSFYPDANNSARLQGPIVGTGSVSNVGLARSLPFRVGDSAEGLALLYASVTPSSDTSSDIVMVVENSSSELHCFAKLEGLRFYDRQGVLIEQILDFGFVDGTLGTHIISTDTCLEPAARPTSRA